MKAKSILVLAVFVVVAASVADGDISLQNSVDVGFLWDIHSQEVAGNILGLAYNPDAEHIYVSRSLRYNEPAFIYTIDLSGNLVYMFDFSNAYESTAEGSAPGKLHYDSDSGHLFTMANVWVEGPGDARGRIVEMSVDGTTVYNDYDVTSYTPRGIVADSGGVYFPQWQGDSVIHLSGDGDLLGEIPIDGMANPDAIPSDMVPSFNDGFFILYYNAGILEIDKTGNSIGFLGPDGFGPSHVLASDPINELLLTVYGSGPGVTVDFFSIEIEDIPPEVIPAPSAILLGSIGVGCVNWILKRKRML